LKRQKLSKESLLTLFARVNPKYCAVKISAVSRKLPRMPELTSEQLEIIKNPESPTSTVTTAESRIAPKPPRASKIARIKAFQVSKANAKRRVMELHNQIMHKKEVVTRRFANKQETSPSTQAPTSMIVEPVVTNTNTNDESKVAENEHVTLSETATNIAAVLPASVGVEALKNGARSLRALLTKAGSQKSLRSNDSGRSNVAKILSLSKRTLAKDDVSTVLSKRTARSNSALDCLDLASPPPESTVSVGDDTDGTGRGSLGIFGQCSFIGGSVDLLGLVDEKLTLEQMAVADETVEELTE